MGNIDITGDEVLERHRVRSRGHGVDRGRSLELALSLVGSPWRVIVQGRCEMEGSVRSGRMSYFNLPHLRLVHTPKSKSQPRNLRQKNLRRKKGEDSGTTSGCTLVLFEFFRA